MPSSLPSLAGPSTPASLQQGLINPLPSTSLAAGHNTPKPVAPGSKVQSRSVNSTRRKTKSKPKAKARITRHLTQQEWDLIWSKGLCIECYRDGNEVSGTTKDHLLHCADEVSGPKKNHLSQLSLQDTMRQPAGPSNSPETLARVKDKHSIRSAYVAMALPKASIHATVQEELVYPPFPQELIQRYTKGWEPLQEEDDTLLDTISTLASLQEGHLGALHCEVQDESPQHDFKLLMES